MTRPETRIAPTGTVTFVLADVERSVALREVDPGAMATATVRFDALVDEIVGGRGGYRPVEQGEGDSFVAVFGVATDAVGFALDLQDRLGTETWATSIPLRVRIAVHSGVAQLRGIDNYMGRAINRCARIRALARGGQVLVSEATHGLVVDELPDGASLIDVGRHRLRDFNRREHVFQLVHPCLGDTSPLLRPPDAANLPSYLTHFIAREDELKSVASALQETALVTLTGAGGIGKTRLAAEYVRWNSEAFTDGVAWTNADTIADPSLLVAQVALALEIREGPTEPLIDTIARELADRKLLLVVDSCEHVLDAAAVLVERLIEAAPGLRVLATSREPLGLFGEVALRVPSLELGAAARLFVDRTSAVAHGFELTVENEQLITDICGRLDGIPLAIELAAGRMKLLTLRQIVDGLNDRFALLTGGSRTALPRQRTLEASVEWSYRLLSEAEQTLLDRLSVFAGGFTLDAARQVCAFGVVRDASVLDLLSALVDKSLVQVDSSAVGEQGRYRLLEAIRHFGSQHLADDADGATVRGGHLTYYMDLAERTAPSIERGDLDHMAALAVIDADLDNLRAAREWAHSRGDYEGLLRIMAALPIYHEIRSHFDEATRWLRIALDAAPSPTELRAKALWGLGDISIFTADFETVLACGEEIITIADQLDDAQTEGLGLLLVGWAASFGAGHEPAWGADAFDHILNDLRTNDYQWFEVDAAIGLCTAAGLAGDVSRAVAAARRALESAARSGNTPLLQRATYYHAWALQMAGDVEEAAEAATTAINLARELDETFFKTGSLCLLSFIRCWQGRYEESLTFADEALALGRRTGSAFGIGLAAAARLQVHFALGDEASAMRVVAEFSDLFDAINTWGVTLLVDGILAMAEARERSEQARARLSAVEARVPEVWLVAPFRGWVERIAGNDSAAESAFTTALDGSMRVGAVGDALAALHEIAVCSSRRVQHERAVRLFAAVEALRASLGAEPRPRPAILGPRADDHGDARDALGDQAFESAWKTGATLSLEEAARFALRGKGGRRRPASGWESLTETELEIVRLVSEGLSNPAIAERMFITRGTVKVHLSHVFTKLGVASRTELAAASVQRLLG